MFTFSDSLKKSGLEVARDIAEWICMVQAPWSDAMEAPGAINFSVDYLGKSDYIGSSWNYGFASMAMAAASKAFDNERYKTVATRLATVLKPKQILDPFHKEHYGAIREFSPLCPWCYTRDAISAAWAFVDMYRFTADEEYLERAKLFGKWFLRKGMDEQGWPWAGVQLDTPLMPKGSIEYCHVEEWYNHILANCEGGCLNFLYQLYLATGDKSWCESMKTIADFFVDHIQQEDGLFLNLHRDTKKPLGGNNVYDKLHRGNDDLGTLGLLCAYRLTKNEKYLGSIKKFLDTIWAAQQEDGLLEDSIAAIPIVLNATYETNGLVEVDGLTEQKLTHAIEAMLATQKDGIDNPLMKGALLEYKSDPRKVTMRANCYALIVLLKLFAGVNQYLSADPIPE